NSGQKLACIILLLRKIVTDIHIYLEVMSIYGKKIIALCYWHYSVTSCLVPICSLYGAAVTTVEGIGSTKTRIHPVQERIAKGHGTQCGFCTPGMVMSIYTLLRNHLQPSTEQLIETLGGNLCRCTGYRPIVESGKSFSAESSCCQMKGTGECCLDQEEHESENKSDVCTKLYQEEEFLPLDPTQEFIFPPELMRMAEEARKKTLVFQGERITWISPATLNDLLELKLQYPQAPLVMGNTFVGPNMKFKDVFHSVIISPARISELNVVMIDANQGLTIGAGCSLAQVKEILTEMVLKLPEEKTQTYQALLKHLRTLAGQQIRNMASLGGHIISRLAASDLNPVLGVGNCVLNLVSKEGTQQLPLNDHFLAGSPDANLTSKQVLASVFIPFSKKWEFVSAFRQAQRQQNALAIVNSGMRVRFKEGTNTIMDLNILYGGVGSVTVSAKKSCQQLIGRAWNEEMLDEACRLVLDEVTIPGSSSGGMVEYKRTLMISFLFKFYLEVLQDLNVRDPRYPDVPNKFQSVLEDFPLTIPCGTQAYECVDSHQPPQDPVGRPVMHQSGIKHASGEAIFCDDMPAIDEELFLAVVTSTRPHAKIISIDASEALALPGVVDVITAQDIPAQNGDEEERLYAQDEVICVGQIVCTVAADSYFHAKQAAKKVNIVYEDMEPVIVTIKDAVSHKSFIGSEKKLEQGNIKEAFQTVDQIIEGEVHMGGQEHFYMETQSVLVIPKTEDKEMEIYVSSQDAALVQVGSSRIIISCEFEFVMIAAKNKDSVIAQTCLCLNVTRLIVLFLRRNNLPDNHGVACNPVIFSLVGLGLLFSGVIISLFDKIYFIFTTGYFRGYKADMDWVKGEGDVYPYFVYGAACSEVEVDCLTGAHKNIRTDIVMDASFSINPAIDIGQIEGAFTQGVGLYTLEELKYSPEGVLYTRSPNEYKIPSITDIPEELNVSLLTSTKNPIAIYSSKGLGESGMFLGSSVFFAIHDAVTAARKERGLTETFTMSSPATPELIRMICVDKFTDLVWSSFFFFSVYVFFATSFSCYQSLLCDFSVGRRKAVGVSVNHNL
uniref:FAD-binding PCMH-type domain-containing protein n=1 Tax=Vombatus ursinus TaxID=29139 RepID=A0A4X2LQ40_VOMUR